MRAWRWRGGSERPRIRWRSPARGFSRAVFSMWVTRRFAGRCSMRPGIPWCPPRRTERTQAAAGSSCSAACMGAIPTAPRTSNRGCWRPSTTSLETDSLPRWRKARSFRWNASSASATTGVIRFRSSCSRDSFRSRCTAATPPPGSTCRRRLRRCAPRPERARASRISSAPVCATIRNASASWRFPTRTPPGVSTRTIEPCSRERTARRAARARAGPGAFAGAAAAPGVARRRIVAAEARPRRDRSASRTSATPRVAGRQPAGANASRPSPGCGGRSARASHGQSDRVDQPGPHGWIDLRAPCNRLVGPRS